MIRVSGLALASGLAAGAAGAQVEPVLSVEGDVEYGEYLSAECTTCHRADGAAQGIPPITGLHPEDFAYALLQYRSGERVHPVMQMIAGRLSDEDIAALAAYFGQLDP